jgi:hypothetical protein
MARGDKAGRRTHLLGMTTFLTVLVVLALLATVGVLFAGLLGMVKGTQDGRRANKLMQYRVLFQGIALLLFIALLYMMRG